MRDAADTSQGAAAVAGASRVLAVPADVEEMRLDLSCERLIRLTGEDRKGRAVRRYLRVTRNGGITVV